jgi:GMP synthase-like glutamine amidotransferase
MPTVHVLQHEPIEGPACIAEVAQWLGMPLNLVRLFDGAAVPEHLPPEDALVLMGGPMGVGDIGDSKWPFLKAEAELITRVLRADGAVLGICLGAQLMAHALGARVYPLHVGDPPARFREVGWGAVTFAVDPDTEPSLRGLSESEVVLHWHGDTFDLPDGSKLLASTLPCQNQMFRWGSRAFGLQFHVEVTAIDVATMVREDAAFVRAANGPCGAARILADTRRWIGHYRQMGNRMIRNIFDSMLADSLPRKSAP